jgi:hypothetical protein
MHLALANRPWLRAGVAVSAATAASVGLAILLAHPSSTRATVPVPQSASDAFWSRWSDGKAELIGYDIVTPRYGEIRRGTAVLVYVTEEMNKRTLIKDDTGRVPESEKEVVLKLNHMLEFRTGIYPYHVMTSTYSPVGSLDRERFAPVKIAFSAQEWCGHVYHVLKPTRAGYESEIRSYFSTEGDARSAVRTEPGTLYEDALWIQLRELDGPFEEGGDWSGKLVPSLWSIRKAHRPFAPVLATIRRAAGERGGDPVTRFEVRYAEFSRTFEVERDGDHRIVSWSTSEGERATLLASTRLPYWTLNGAGDERYLSELGLTPPKADEGSRP